MTPEEKLAEISRLYRLWLNGKFTTFQVARLIGDVLDPLWNELAAPLPEETPIEWTRDTTGEEGYADYSGDRRTLKLEIGEIGFGARWLVGRIYFDAPMDGTDPARVRLFCERVVRLLNEVQP